jgi:hypothetical protein
MSIAESTGLWGFLIKGTAKTGKDSLWRTSGVDIVLVEILLLVKILLWLGVPFCGRLAEFPA